MKRPLSVLLLLFFLIAGTSFAQEADTVLLRQFTYSDYNAGINNYSGSVGDNGIVFFSNSQGVLIYDGADWELIKIGDGSPVISLLFDKDTLYVGANDEFGFLLQDEKNKWVYTSLTNLTPHSEGIDDVWQIVRTTDGIYFESYNFILRYDGKEIALIDIANTYIFNLDNQLFGSSFYNGFNLIIKDEIVDSLYIRELDNDAAFSILPAEIPDEYLLFTSEHGAFVLTLNPIKLTPWDVPVNQQLKDDGFYHGVEYQDSLIICTTWDKGIILFNKKGDFIKQVDISSGLPNRSLLELFVDNNDNIWIPSRSGIYQMRLSLDKISDSFKPKTIIKDVKSELGLVKDFNNIYDPEYLIFAYTTPGLNKEDLEYSFLLEGYDTEWTSWSKQYLKEYYNLSNGTYSFHVKARILNSELVSDEGSLSFVIERPWYKLTTSYLIASLLIVVITIVLLRVRSLELNKAKLALERLVSERTKELVDEREKLKSLNEELVVANAELDNFVYRSSHDLVAPLKSLRGLMVVTRLDTTDPKILEYISMMESSALKLEKFINSIMEYSINAKSGSNSEEVDLNEILDGINEEIKFFDKFASIKIQRNIDDAVFLSDPKRLKIVMSNLITNAIKYHNINQDKPWIKINSYQKNGTHYIEVEDNGLGISEDQVDKIFDMFYRASETSEGSGLGLYIVKDTMKKLNGEVSIETKISKGSKFTLIFAAK